MDQKWVSSFDRLGRQVLEKLRNVSKSTGLGREAAGSGDEVRVVTREKQGHRLPVKFLGWKNEWGVTPVIP